MKLKQFLTAALLLCSIGAWAQTNLIAGWDGGDDTSSPSNFGWTSSANRTLNARNASGGIRMTTTYSGYKLEDGTSYSYSASSAPSSVIFWVRYNTSGESFTYTFQGLEADTYYDFSGLVGWHNNSSNPTFTVVLNDGTNTLATMSKAISTKTTLYEVSARFKTPSTMTSTTNVNIVFTCSQTGDCMEAISALSLVKVNIVLKDDLASAIAYATTVNSYLSDSDLASAITTAQGVYNNDAATQTEVNTATSTLETAISTAINNNPLTLINPGFESCTVTTSNAAATGSAAPLDIAGAWTQTSSAAWSSSAVVEYGGAGQVNGASAPSADNLGNGGYTLGVSVGWGGTVIYKSVTATWPAGVYTIKVNAYNANSGATQFKSLFGFVPTTGSATLSTKTSFTYDTWETDQVTFTLNEATEGAIQVGGQAISDGSGKNAKVFFDNITVTYQDPVAGARTLWEEAKAAAEAAVANDDYENVIGEELDALNAEIAKVEPTTLDGYNAATEALNEATATFVAAKANYDAFFDIATSDYVITLDYGTETKRQQLDEACSAEPTSASDADEKTAAVYTALRAYYESHAMAEGVADAVDMTSRITNATDPTNNDGWTWTGNKNNPASNEPWTDADGTNTHSYFDGGNWNASSWTTTMKQTITLPAGKFLLTAKARAAENTTFTMAVGENNVALPNVGNSGNVFNNGWGDASLEFTTDGSDVEILVTATSNTEHEWFSISDFRLVRLELYTEMATAADYEAMADALVAAKAKTLGFDEGEYAPYNNVEAIEAIAAAEAVDTDAENAKDEIETITSALGNWTANTTEVDAIYDGILANAPIQATSENVVLPGWVTKSGNTRQTFSGTGEDGKACLADAEAQVGLFVHPGTYNYGETIGYTMPLKAGVLYQAEAKYCAWASGSNNDFTLTILKGNATVETKSYGANHSACTEEGALKSVKLYFTVSEDADYILSVITNGNTFMTDFHLKKAVAENVTIDENTEYTPAETFANVTLKRNFKVNGWNTFVVPFDIPNEILKDTFGDDVQVAVFSDEGESANAVTVNFNKMDTPAITANTPVLLKPTLEELSNQIYFNAFMIEAGTPVVGGNYFDFTGTYAATTTIDEGDYFISANKLYKSTGGTIIKGTRAYLKAKSEANNVKLFIEGEGIVTAIESIDDNAIVNGIIYNIAGQRVNKAQKGIYIVNGKKVIIK